MSEANQIATTEPTPTWPANGLDTSDGRRLALALQGEQPTLGTPHSKERWTAYAELPAQLSVLVPLPRLSLSDLLNLKPGTLLRTDWQISQDVSLLVGDVFLAYVSCEPAGDRLGVRINGFEQQVTSL